MAHLQAHCSQAQPRIREGFLTWGGLGPGSSNLTPASPCLDSLASEPSALITWPGNDPGFPHGSLCGLSETVRLEKEDSDLPLEKSF